MKLFGVMHGGETNNTLSGETRSVPFGPSGGLLHDLYTLPTGARVGVEWLSPDDERDILEHFCRTLELDPSDADKVTRGNGYWERLVVELKAMGHDVVYLDSKQDLFRVHEAIPGMRAATADPLFRLESESDFAYHAKLVRHNNQVFHEETELKKRLVLERDAHLLAAVKDQNLAAAVVGIGHSDHWMHQLPVARGIVIDSYAREEAFLEKGFCISHNFIRNAQPDPQIVFDMTSLERKVRFLETGRVMDGPQPDYVGSWSYPMPSTGYFEMFVEEADGGRIRGRIEDFIGTATFEGERTPERIRFTKQYGEDSLPMVIPQPLLYEGISSSAGVYRGTFSPRTLWNVFALMEKKSNPLTLSMFMNVYLRMDALRRRSLETENGADRARPLPA